MELGLGSAMLDKYANPADDWIHPSHWSAKITIISEHFLFSSAFSPIPPYQSPKSSSLARVMGAIRVTYTLLVSNPRYERQHLFRPVNFGLIRARIKVAG